MKRIIIDFWNQRVCAFLATLLIVSLSACGGDEPEGENGNENGGGTDSEFNLSENEKKFVGSWYVSVNANSHTFTFFPNRRVIRDSSKSGMWEYDETSKILATSVDMWQFQLTMLMDETWTGITINTGRGVNAERTTGNWQYFHDYMEMTVFGKDGYNPFDAGRGSISYSDIVIEGSTIKARATARDSSDRTIGFADITITNAYGEEPQAVLDTYLESPENPLMKGTYSGGWYDRG